MSDILQWLSRWAENRLEPDLSIYRNTIYGYLSMSTTAKLRDASIFFFHSDLPSTLELNPYKIRRQDDCTFERRYVLLLWRNTKLMLNFMPQVQCIFSRNNVSLMYCYLSVQLSTCLIYGVQKFEKSHHFLKEDCRGLWNVSHQDVDQSVVWFDRATPVAHTIVKVLCIILSEHSHNSGDGTVFRPLHATNSPLTVMTRLESRFRFSPSEQQPNRWCISNVSLKDADSSAIV